MPAQAPGIRADVRTSTLFIHDNLAVLRGLDSESVDLIATDPPFNTKRVFKAPAESRATGQRFDDRWRWNDVTAEWSDVLASDRPGVRKVIEAAAAIEGGSVEPRTGAIMTGRTTNSMAAYLCWMAPRLAECRRILKPTGSIYLHCDDSADSYLRLLMDAVFGRAAYRNTIIWKRQSGNNSATDRCGRITDTLLFYAPGRNTWNGGRHNTLSPGELREYKLAPDGRRYKCDDLTAARPDSDSGNFEWRGCLPPPSRGWAYRLETLEKMLAAGEIELRRGGRAKMRGRIRWLDENQGQKLQSLWTDIGRAGNTSRERTGWATQKPTALYERIVEASSNPGDLVVDPFCGCCTTLVAAERLGRDWIGCDIDPAAEARLHEQMAKLVPDDPRQPSLEIAEAFDVQTTPPTRTRTVPSCRVGSTGLHALPARC